MNQENSKREQKKTINSFDDLYGQCLQDKILD